MQNFGDRLADVVRRKNTAVMVGLDPRADQLPQELLAKSETNPQTVARAYTAFCQGVIDAIAPLVPIVKPQAAFFEALGPAGMQSLAEVISYAKEKELLVVLDGKRNDIGSTAEAYAQAYLGPDSAWGADALTVNAYLGDDSLQPFLETAEKQGAGIFVLVKTSNPGGGRLQDLEANGTTIYRHVAEMVERLAQQTAGESGYGIVGAVCGATYPQQLAELRQAMPSCWLLVPGYGAQGGGAADVKAGFDSNGLGAVINNSRGIIFAHAKPQYAELVSQQGWQAAVRAATEEMIEQLRVARQ